MDNMNTLDFLNDEETIIVETSKLLCGDFSTIWNRDKYSFGIEAGCLKIIRLKFPISNY